MDITTARTLEDAIRHLADARLAGDPLTRLAALSQVHCELADVLSRVVADLVSDEVRVDDGGAGSGDAA